MGDLLLVAPLIKKIPGPTALRTIRAVEATDVAAGAAKGAAEAAEGACFVAGTMVETPDGDKPIESLEVGDLVYAYDDGLITARVSRTFQHVGDHAADEIVDVTVRTEDGKESVIQATPNHPFFVPDRNEYVELGSLTPGVLLLTADQQTATILSMNYRDGKFDVYNIEVEGPHNYFVSDQKVLVHNKAAFARKPGIWSGKKVNNFIAKQLGLARKQLGNAVEKFKKSPEGAGRGGADNINIEYPSGEILDSNGESIGNIFDHVQNLKGRSRW